ncbi:DNRLRE domain-containing protein [Modestobacter sp. SYSU DS0875]
MLGVAIASALLVETFVVVGHANAAPPAPDAPAQEEPARGPGGGLEAPDAASARTIARLEGEKVEVVGDRTETSTTWALPDGSMSTGLASGPVWIRTGDGDGTSSADWAAVDLTLELADDGTVQPKAHPADLVLAGEGTSDDGLLVSMNRQNGESVGIEWTGSLLAPRLEGPRATYEDVQPGVDLIVEATRTGYEQFFVLTERPQEGEAPDLTLRVRSDGLDAGTTPDGGMQFTDESGNVVAQSGTPLAWDAGVDGERLHPVTQPWTPSDGPGLATAPEPEWHADPSAESPNPEPSTGGTDDPALPEMSTDETPPGAALGQQGDVAAEQAKANPGLPLSAAAEVVEPGVVELDLAPEEEFLQDAATEYPVVVDPEQNYTGWFDTWVQHGYSTDQSGSPELRIGTFDGGATVARSFINLDMGGMKGKLIQHATLSLYNWHSWSCSARNWEVWSTDQAGTGTRINTQPTWWHRWATSNGTKGHSSACGEGGSKPTSPVWCRRGPTTMREPLLSG